MTEGKKNLVVTIDEELHRKFKIHCTEQKTSIKKMIIKLISEELDGTKERGLKNSTKKNKTTIG